MVLHVSDTHLGAAPYGLTLRYRDVYEAFVEAMEIALREHVDLVVHTGDFFNSPNPPPDAYMVAAKVLRKLRDRDVKVIAIAGQHDMPKRRGLSPLQVLESLGLLKYVAVDEIAHWRIEDLEIVAVPYKLRDEISKLKSHGKGILAAHLILRETGVPQYDARLADLPEGFSYIALGDYHKHLELRLSNGTPVVYTGSTEVLRRDEVTENGRIVTIVDLSKREAHIQKVTLRTPRPWIAGRFTDVKTAIKTVTERAKQFVSNGLKTPIVYVELECKNSDLTEFYHVMDNLLKKNLIAYYKVEILESWSRDFEKVVLEEVGEVTLRSVVREVVGNDILASRILELLNDPSRESARKFVDEIASNKELKEALFKLLVKTKGRLPTRKTRAVESRNSHSFKKTGLAKFIR